MATEVVEGAKDLHAKLAALERKVASKLERQGIRAGTKVFADEIRRKVPVLTGLLKSAITVRALKRKKGRTGYRVTIKTDKINLRDKKFKLRYRTLQRETKVGKKKFFYPAILEYGAEHRPAQAPMRKSFHAKKDAALQRVIDSIKEGIRDAIK